MTRLMLGTLALLAIASATVAQAQEVPPSAPTRPVPARLGGTPPKVDLTTVNKKLADAAEVQPASPVDIDTNGTEKGVQKWVNDISRWCSNSLGGC